MAREILGERNENIDTHDGVQEELLSLSLSFHSAG